MSLPVVFPAPLSAVAVPLGILLLLFGLSYGLNADFALAGFWYQLQGQHWALQHFWLTEEVLHRGVRSLNQWLIAALLLHFLLRLALHKCGQPLIRHNYGQPHTRHVRRISSTRWDPNQQQAHGRLLLSLLLSLVGVAILKQLIPMDCPWDLQAFGVAQPFTGLFSAWPAHREANACFPAGHASIGFAWLALYFFCLQLNPRLALPALLLTALLGASLGLVQQLRGAHFLSHDIASAAWCWSMACLCAYWPALRRRSRASQIQATAAIPLLNSGSN